MSVPQWKPMKLRPMVDARREGGTTAATRLFMAGRRTPCPSPTMPGREWGGACREWG